MSRKDKRSFSSSTRAFIAHPQFAGKQSAARRLPSVVLKFYQAAKSQHAPAHSGWLFTSRKCSFGGLYFDIDLRLARLRTQPPTKPCRSARNDFAYFAL